MDKKVRFLHICRDDKFLRGVITRFPSMSDMISSEFIILKGSSKPLKYIDENDLTVFTNRKSFRSKLKEGGYDVVYFHSLPPNNYWMINSIPKDKIIIWWSWGYDIYNGGIWGWKSFINIDLIKPETKKIQNQSRSLVRKVLLFFIMLYYEIYGRLTRPKVLNRIDYFRPVLPVEYDMMKMIREFKAKEYYPLLFGPSYHVKLDEKESEGWVIIGNSASAFNNHADVWKIINKYLPKNRSVIVPLSYGTLRYAKKVKEVITGNNVRFLDAFLPKDEYFNIMNHCSYAVYGSIRQHAMGNIHHALSEGIKVFLFKNSIVYRSLKDMGFAVYAIEDIDYNSFLVPLSKAELAQNEMAYDKWREHVSYVKTKAMREIEKSIS